MSTASDTKETSQRPYRSTRGRIAGRAVSGLVGLTVIGLGILMHQLKIDMYSFTILAGLTITFVGIMTF